VHQAETGDTACDHFHRFRDDIALMRSIGLQAYRLSLSWPRVLHADSGKPNEKGLEFYDRLIDVLLSAGIEPWITLFHWDMPTELYRRGGWLNRESADWFAEYAGLISRRLSDRVVHWMTLNEPQVYIGLGHGDGKHAPGLKLSFRDCLLASHNTLLAHGQGVLALRANAKRKLSIGWAPVGHVVCPATDAAADIDAARGMMFTTRERNVWNNTWFGDAVCKGEYPADALELFGSDVPEIRDGDMKTIHQPIDFFGVNIYSGSTVRAGDDGKAVPVPAVPGAPVTAFGWPIHPESLYWGPRFLQERYGLPIVITENGMSNIDVVDADGRVQDPQRIEFTRRYLLQLGKAIEDGVRIDGYFHWSIMDNFEWAEGYKQRFGLIHVDFQTQKRTLKESAHWYRTVIETNGGALSPEHGENGARPIVRTTIASPATSTKGGPV
jgi:beta-glucosidase